MLNVANDKLFNGEFHSTLEGLDLYESALSFEIKTFPDLASDEERKDLELVRSIRNEYREKLLEMEKELIQEWSGKSSIHDQIVACIQENDFTGLAF
ncbi:hypothetical protein [Synechococcus sp. PCC 6312]|uniref:hypothetical protein n=1 Tax=Synechococcus sp. (strain ATCC 27167 / PCC 6312) TaxID=195253 RepID=UPI00029F3284|nr:hypothetical protein [Synechococcus sp. PCC 6312]AFY61924.1 hypothetical protein Syn6312_2860 [Synechococcus sp. PCC 6312]